MYVRFGAANISPVSIAVTRVKSVDANISWKHRPNYKD
jgi:hypothetical protein